MTSNAGLPVVVVDPAYTSARGPFAGARQAGTYTD